MTPNTNTKCIKLSVHGFFYSRNCMCELISIKIPWSTLLTVSWLFDSYLFWVAEKISHLIQVCGVFNDSLTCNISSVGRAKKSEIEDKSFISIKWKLGVFIISPTSAIQHTHYEDSWCSFHTNNAWVHPCLLMINCDMEIEFILSVPARSVIASSGCSGSDCFIGRFINVWHGAEWGSGRWGTDHRHR